MNIRFGPAGIPLSCKGRTLKDGIEDIHALQLDAMEVQLLRPMRDIPEDLDLIKELGEELDVKLSLHAPYYMDLLGDEVYRQRSIDNILWAGEMAQALGADILSIHQNSSYLMCQNVQRIYMNRKRFKQLASSPLDSTQRF